MMERRDDAELVRQVLEGHQEAFSKLVTRYQNVVYGIILSLVEDFAVAEDLVQETLLSAYLHLRTLDEPARFGNWLRIIAANRARTYLRQRRPTALPFSAGEAPVPAHVLSAEQLAAAQEEARQQRFLENTTLEALRRLPALSRQLLVLYSSGNCTIAEAGRVLGLSGPAAKMRLHRTRRQLQKEVIETVEKTLAQKKPALKFVPAEVTVLNADLLGVATWRRDLGALKLAELLGEGYEVVAAVVAEYGGTLDHYKGTSFTALYGEPLPCEDHAPRACLAALDLKRRLSEWREKNDLPPLGFRCGLCSGQVLVGSLGSGRRTDYTLVGEPVELAGYLKQLAGSFSAPVAVSDATYQQVRPLVEARFLDRISFSGSGEIVEVHQILSPRGELTQECAQIIGCYRQGLESYRQGQWAAAQTCFEQACGDLYNPRDWPSRRYADRCWLRLEVPGFAGLAQLQEAEMESLLRQVDQRDLSAALREVDLEIREAFFRVMSQRVRRFMEEEIEQLALNSYSREEIAQTQRKILQLAGHG
jgi:RNA polymerase sigma factor (sigma-70 family)